MTEVSRHTCPIEVLKKIAEMNLGEFNSEFGSFGDPPGTYAAGLVDVELMDYDSDVVISLQEGETVWGIHVNKEYRSPIWFCPYCGAKLYEPPTIR